MSEADTTDTYKVVSAMARETFRVQFTASNPDATEAETLAAWQAADRANLRSLARRTIRYMERRGISFSVASNATDE